MSNTSMTLVVPARNEAAHLDWVLPTAHAALPANTLLVLADSASTDDTPAVARSWLAHLPNLRYWRAEKPGKGLAVREAWRAFPADYLAFMDADLATDLAALPRLKSALDRADLAIGSRRHPLSRVQRPLLRRLVSRCFGGVLHSYFPDLPYRDTTCGFKGIRAEVFRQLEPLVLNEQWFFDTELVLHAHWQGHAVRELAIRWREEPSRPSSVHLLRVSCEYLQELNRLCRLRQITPPAHHKAQATVLR
ncbi:glycosyltransferase [Gloeobacter morelensis]|uniref:Glycosyltransferase n=1 Tax=Gloeobacter morelensis MG652769 TaxID=2781736 RepID=A0ABY3PG69_9CYAN|nr:glycosyltransferase [Gloeobacter morelensis]UFP92603.1 glycosyltransferase [Gloeobacter morelensis MG652769]